MARKMPAQRPGESRQDYATPWEFIRAVEQRYGRLYVDLAARIDNTRAPRFVSPKEDSLTVPWAQRFPGKLGWLNPEFARIELWAEKCRVEASQPGGLRIALFTPASVGSNWFAEHVHGHALVLALSPRITFEGETDPYPKDCILSLFGFGQVGFDVWRWK